MMRSQKRRCPSGVIVKVIVFVRLVTGAGESAFAASATVRVGYPQPSGAMLPL